MSDYVDKLVAQEDDGPKVIPPFVDLSSIILPGSLGECSVKHYHVSAMDALRSGRSYPIFYSPPGGPYVVMHVGNTLMMSNTPMEQKTNLPFVNCATGHVLIAGLGIGLCLPPLLKNPLVQKITVIELSSDVRDYILPRLQQAFDCTKLEVVIADIFEYQPERGTKFDTIWFDIWAEAHYDGPQVHRLKLKYRSRLNKENPRAWMGAWIESFRGMRG